MNKQTGSRSTPPTVHRTLNSEHRPLSTGPRSLFTLFTLLLLAAFAPRAQAAAQQMQITFGEYNGAKPTLTNFPGPRGTDPATSRRFGPSYALRYGGHGRMGFTGWG